MLHRFSYWQRSDNAIADLKDEATQSGGAQKYAKTMLKLLTGRRTVLAMKKKWPQAAWSLALTFHSVGLTGRAPPVKSSRPRREAPRYAGNSKLPIRASLVLGAALVRGCSCAAFLQSTSLGKAGR